MPKKTGHDWRALETEFQRAYSELNIDLKEWCELKGINYNTARRHIKQRDAVLLSQAELYDQNCAFEKPVDLEGPSNQYAVSHGGYSAFIDQEYLQQAYKIESLQSELDFSRGRLMMVAKLSSSELSRQCASAIEIDDRQLKLLEVEDRLVGRIESLTMKLAKLEAHRLSLEKDKLQLELLKTSLKEREQDGTNVVFNIDW